MENPIAILVAFAACSGWAAVLLQWWSHRDDWMRAKFNLSLKEWRAQTEQARILYGVAEELSIALGQERNVAHQTLKQQFREASAKKLGQDPQLELLQPWRLRATLRKIEGRMQHLDVGLRFRFPRRRRAPGGRPATP